MSHCWCSPNDLKVLQNCTSRARKMAQMGGRFESKMPRVPRRSNSERTRYTSNAAARIERISTIGYVRSVSWKRSFELNCPRPKYRIYRHSDLKRGSILLRVGGRGEGGSGARQV